MRSFRGIVLTSLFVALSGNAFGDDTYNYRTCYELWRSEPDSLGKISFLKIVGGGNGCGANLQGSIAQDGQAFTVFYNDFTADTLKPRIACAFNVTMCVPQGYKVALTTVSNMGSYNLTTNGASFKATAAYRIQGGSEIKYETRVRRNSNGTCYTVKNGVPSSYVGCSDSLTTTDRFNIISKIWSPCGAKRDFGVRNVLEQSGMTRNDYLALDVTDVSLSNQRDIYKIGYYWTDDCSEI